VVLTSMEALSFMESLLNPTGFHFETHFVPASCWLLGYSAKSLSNPKPHLAPFYKNSFVGVSYSISLNTSFGMNPSNHSSSAVSLTLKKFPGSRPVAVELT
jgi:hypothetical protein